MNKNFSEKKNGNVVQAYLISPQRACSNKTSIHHRLDPQPSGCLLTTEGSSIAMNYLSVVYEYVTYIRIRGCRQNHREMQNTIQFSTRVELSLL